MKAVFTEKVNALPFAVKMDCSVENLPQLCSESASQFLSCSNFTQWVNCSIRANFCILVSKTSSASMKMMVSNGYAGGGSSGYGYDGRNSFRNKIYKRLEPCLVIPPPRGKLLGAIIKFLDGAIIGAIPEVTCSNGALPQVLTGSYFAAKIPKDNAIISLNNRPATEAVPYFEQGMCGRSCLMLLELLFQTEINREVPKSISLSKEGGILMASDVFWSNNDPTGESEKGMQQGDILQQHSNYQCAEEDYLQDPDLSCFDIGEIG
ncbi:hypothetical protein SDJN03_13850, partial [Cucurbita argyrosperma subsp. sororia]